MTLASIMNSTSFALPAIIGLYLTYNIAIFFYNILFHPLRKFPGPWYATGNRIPYLLIVMNGNWLHWIQSLHEKYGEVVRVAPDELSFHDSRAWNDIYGHRISGKAFFPKDLRFYLLKNPIYPDTNPIVMENNVEEHGRVRKVFSHAFSNQALKKQEPLLLTHVTQFVRELQEKRGSDFDLVAMLNFVTFEMMSDLAFSESMGLFEGNQESIKWVESLSAELKMATLVRAGLYYPSFLKLLQFLTPRSLKEQRMYHVKRANERVDRRIGRDRKQTDIWSLTEREDADGKTMLSVPEMHVNAKNFLIAGTETTATALSALNYYLLKNPAKLKKLTDEIRASFTSTEDMSLERLAQLKYLGVCIDEGLRLHPPVPIGLGRIVPKGGKMISDYWVPEGTVVAVEQYTAYHDPAHFRHPNDFIPERWIDPAFDTDDKAAFNPFLTGPRNCLGKNMAYHEMRLIEAELLFNFDLRLQPESDHWNKQKTYFLWEKPSLMVTATPVQR